MLELVITVRANEVSPVEIEVLALLVVAAHVAAALVALDVVPVFNTKVTGAIDALGVLEGLLLLFLVGLLAGRLLLAEAEHAIESGLVGISTADVHGITTLDAGSRGGLGRGGRGGEGGGRGFTDMWRRGATMPGHLGLGLGPPEGRASQSE